MTFWTPEPIYAWRAWYLHNNVLHSVAMARRLRESGYRLSDYRHPRRSTNQLLKRRMVWGKVSQWDGLIQPRLWRNRDPRWLRAECRVGADCWFLDGDAPHWGGWCGFWGMKYPSTPRPFWHLNSGRPEYMVLGIVELRGRIIEHGDGYRAEYARPRPETLLPFDLVIANYDLDPTPGWDGQKGKGSDQIPDSWKKYLTPSDGDGTFPPVDG